MHMAEEYYTSIHGLHNNFSMLVNFSQKNIFSFFFFFFCVCKSYCAHVLCQSALFSGPFWEKICDKIIFDLFCFFLLPCQKHFQVSQKFPVTSSKLNITLIFLFLGVSSILICTFFQELCHIYMVLLDQMSVFSHHHFR